MKSRRQLRLIGITYNQIESGVYAVILEEVGGNRRIPIIIGYPEAQAIECKLQEVSTPRPLTHDLLKNVMESFKLHLSCVEIHKLPNGVFAADLVIEGPDGSLQRIDSRSSDAIALAIRTGAPIYTSAEVLEESGFSPRPSGEADQEAAAQKEKDYMSNYSDKEIEEMISRCAVEENYEEAARLKRILKERTNEREKQ